MKEEVIQHFEDFLNDFQYFRLDGYDVFSQSFQLGDKLVVLNTTPYEDGLMLEVQLALRINQVEDIIFGFYSQDSIQLSLSYWESLSQIMTNHPKRSFLQNRIELSKTLSEIENALVKKGFSWLDQLSDLSSISNYLTKVIFDVKKKPQNIFKLSQRSYLLKFMLGEKMTESVFYNYYEQLRFCKVPEHQLEEFLDFKSFVDSKFT